MGLPKHFGLRRFNSLGECLDPGGVIAKDVFEKSHKLFGKLVWDIDCSHFFGI